MGSWANLTAAWKLIRKGYGRYASRLAGLVALGVVGGLFEGLGANALVPLFGSVAGGLGDDPVTRFIGSAFSRFGIPLTIGPLLVLIASLFVLRAVVTLAVSVIKARITTSYEKEERRRLFGVFLRARWPFLLEQKLGHLEMVLLTNVRNAAVLLEHLCAVLILAASLSVYFLVALSISAPITLLAALVGGVVFFLIRPLFRKTNKFSHEVEEMNRATAHFLNENVLGMKTVKALTAEAAVERRGEDLFERFRRLSRRIIVTRAMGDAIFQPLGIIFVCVVFAVMAHSAAGLGAAAAIIYLIQRMFSYFQQLQGSMQAINEFSPYLRALLRLEEAVTGVRETAGGGAPFRLAREIAFQDVGLAYPDGRVGLDGVSFSVRKGETVGIIGPSGAGKTTLVDLLLRLFDPTRGAIAVDGAAAGTFELESWRRRIGYVGQDIFLLNGTIAENIRFHDAAIDDAAVKEAARQAAVEEFVRALPHGYDTVVGERGIALSAGQRQRIIIARVLARKPEVLVLDEATSALDNESEAKVQAVIAGLKGKLTVLIIAHRLSTVLGTDRIIALDKGRIVEQGDPKKLIDDPASYLHKAYHAGRHV